MKNQKKAVVQVATLGLRLAGAVGLVLCLVQCGPEQPGRENGEEDLGSVSSATGTEHCGGLTCTGPSTCTLAANLPLCAESLSAQCYTATHQCVWKVKTDTSCACIEHDVRLCQVSAGVAGTQICTANGARTSTSWAACAATPLCTP